MFFAYTRYFQKKRTVFLNHDFVGLFFLQTVPVGFVKSFKGEFRGEIKLETRNGESYCVGVVKQPDKVSFSAGWGVFVKTYDLHTDDSCYSNTMEILGLMS